MYGKSEATVTHDFKHLIACDRKTHELTVVHNNYYVSCVVILSSGRRLLRVSWIHCLYILAAAASRSLLHASSVHSFFHLVRRFWYQVLTCFSVSPRLLARVQRSCFVRYFCWLNFRSNSWSWLLEKVVRFFLFLLLVHLSEFWHPSLSSSTSSSSSLLDVDKDGEIGGESGRILSVTVEWLAYM